MESEEVGRVTGYFRQVSVASVLLMQPLRLGDVVRIHGHTTDMTITVDSMQIDHTSVSEASPGMEVGIKVPDRVRDGDRVKRVQARQAAA